MNREIKFRYWSEDTKEMVYGKKAFGILNEIIQLNLIVANTMQYTGLKDKNGKEIYARDIIEKGGLRFEVLFDNGSFIIMREKRKHMDYLLGNASSAEVIGNVWENPELLEENK